MKHDLKSPPMTEAMQHVMANLMELSGHVSELESGWSTWVPDPGRVAAHTAEIRK